MTSPMLFELSQLSERFLELPNKRSIHWTLSGRGIAHTTGTEVQSFQTINPVPRSHFEQPLEKRQHTSKTNKEESTPSLTPKLIRIHINHHMVLAQQMRSQHSNILLFRRQNPNYTKRIPINSLLRTILIPRQPHLISANIEHQVRQLRPSFTPDRSAPENAVRFGADGFVYLFGGFGGQADGWVEVETSVDGFQWEVEFGVAFQ
jgi:hypothetical protein